MRVKFVKMSGTNETTDIKKLAALLACYPFAEIGVQVNEKKCAESSERMYWIFSLASYLRSQTQVINAALHINPSWVEDFGQGLIVPELKTLLNMQNLYGCPFFHRLQLNFRIGRDRTPDAEKLMTLMKCYGSRRFILSFNESNAAFIRDLYNRGARFDLLFDSSHGEGIAPAHRPTSVFNNVLQGYAGGLSPENVAEVLDHIAEQEQLVPNFSGISIDAEGKLKNEQGVLDLERSAAYLKAADRWIKTHFK